MEVSFHTPRGKFTLALIEGCKHSLDFVVPVEDVQAEQTRVVAELKRRVKLPGFRPGKAPAGIIEKQFAGDIRQQVLEGVLPKALRKRFDEENLDVVSSPDVTKLSFEPGEPITFTAEFEVAPTFELNEYKGLDVAYAEPEVTEDDIDKRIADLRDRRAEFVNIDPRPLEKGDHAVIAIESLEGVEGEPLKQDELVLELGGEGTVEAFTENLTGAAPGDVRVFDVTYPADYAQERLSGKTVKFQTTVKGIRRKELPEVNDEFAQDLGDYKTLEELREAIRKSMFAERQMEAQEEAKNALIEKLVDGHEFPVPETYIDKQIENRLTQSLRSMASEGIDVSKFKPDWAKLKEAQKDRAAREVRASLILAKVSEREAIAAMRDDVDKEVERIARQQREPVAALKLRFEKDGTLNRIANHIQTQKTLTFLFDQAKKVTPPEPPAAESTLETA